MDIPVKTDFTTTYAEKVLNTAFLAGTMLIRSGSEIRRAEETVVRICRAYGLEVKASVFSLTNALMASYDNDECQIHVSKIEAIPPVSIHLEKVVLINRLSREIEREQFPIEEAYQRLEEIEEVKNLPYLVMVLIAAVSSFCFSLLLGGNLADGITSFFAGSFAYAFVEGVGNRISKIVSHTIGGMIFALFAHVAPMLFPEFEMTVSAIIIGSMMPLVPGVSFTNGFRDIAQGDYLSGVVKLVDAFTIAICMAAGATITAHILNLLGGVQ